MNWQLLGLHPFISLMLRKQFAKRISAKKLVTGV